MFQVTTLVDNDDTVSKIPKKKIEDKTKPEKEWESEDKIDYKTDFFGKKTNLTVSG